MGEYVKNLLKKTLPYIVAMLCLFSFLFASSGGFVLAGQPNTMIRNAPTNIAQGQSMESLVVIGHDAIISGTVTDTVFVIQGDVHLTRTSHTGVVIALGGTVTEETGAKVLDSISLDFNNTLLNNTLMALMIMVGFWGIRIALSVLLVIVPILIVLIFRNRLQKPIDILRQSPIKLGVIGLVLSILISVVSSLIGLTIIGLPITIILLLVLFCAAAFGYAIVAYYIGDFLFQERFKRDEVWFSTLTGATLVTALSNLPLLGWILLLMVLFVSVGVAAVSLWQRRMKTENQ